MGHLSLCRGSVRGTWRGVSFPGTLEAHVREGFGRGTSLSYGDSVRGTWREGSHTEDSEKWVLEGSGNGAFLFAGAPQRESKGIKQGKPRPIWLLGWNLYLIYFSAVYNLECL
jgi:hypothetical protein